MLTIIGFKLGRFQTKFQPNNRYQTAILNYERITYICHDIYNGNTFFLIEFSDDHIYIFLICVAFSQLLFSLMVFDGINLLSLQSVITTHTISLEIRHFSL